MATIQSAIALTDDFSPQLSRMQQNLDKMSSSCRGVETSTARMNTVMDSSVTKLGMISAAAFGAYQAMQMIAGTVKGALNLSDEYSNTKARLDLMNDGLQSTRELQGMIFKSAMETGGAYQDTADAIAKMGILAPEAFSSSGEIVKFMEQINKQFAISGTSAVGHQAAMLQLTQAMGSGVLRGEELNSVLEQAPTIVQTIGRYLGKSTGEIRNMAAEGKITASVVKEAMLSMAGQTDETFAKMPITWGRAFTMLDNIVNKAFEPVWTAIGRIANNGNFEQLLVNITPVLSNMATMLAAIIYGISSAVETAIPIIQTVFSALTTGLYVALPLIAAYGAYWVAANIPIWANAIATGTATTATVIWTAVTNGMTAAMRILNLTIAFNPISLLVGAVVLVIAAFVAWMAAAGTLRDGIASVFGAIMDIAETAINFVISWINLYIKAVNKASEVFNKVFGTQIGQVDVIGKVSLEGSKQAGQEWIKNFDPMESMKKLTAGIDVEGGAGSTTPNAAETETAKNTKGIKDAMEITDEDLKYLRDIAERDFVQQYQVAEIKVDMTGMQNTITKEADLRQDVGTMLRDIIEEELAISAEGSHI